MNLPFKEYINQKPTFFVQKIWNSFAGNMDLMKQYWGKYKVELEARGLDIGYNVNAKIHTIREDSTDRWKAGNKIHFVINNRTPKRFQFSPIIFVESIQKIEIEYFPMKCGRDKPIIKIDGLVFYDGTVNNAFYKGESNLKTLAKNDGFDSTEDFLNYFNKDFTGKIIHWTNHKY